MLGQTCVRRLAILAAAVLSLSSASLAAPSVDDGAAPTIIGGTVAKPGAWPSVIAIVSAAQKNNYAAQFCAGSLIARRYVLTAAHCVADLVPSDIEVLVGTQDLSKGGRRIGVAAIYVHPDYDESTSDSDVAVIRLTKAARGIKLMKLATLSTEANFGAPGKGAMAVGWGDTDPGPAASYPEKMRQVDVRIISNATCNADTAYAGQLTDRMICAGVMAGGKDSCQGDSGGPLIILNGRNRYRIQVGVVSWGYGCAEAGYPGVYSRIARLNGWIRQRARARN